MVTQMAYLMDQQTTPINNLLGIQYYPKQLIFYCKYLIMYTQLIKLVHSAKQKRLLLGVAIRSQILGWFIIHVNKYAVEFRRVHKY